MEDASTLAPVLAAWGFSSNASVVTIAGGLIIGMTEALSIRYLGADFVDISVYGLLLLILMIRPTGLFGGAPAGARA